MKKIILSCLMLIAFNISAKEWEPHWIAALENCHNGNYGSAEQLFSLSVNLMENGEEPVHPSIYIDRAGFYLLMNKNEDSIEDINKALACKNLKHRERVRAVSTRLAANINLGRLINGFEEDVEFLSDNFEIQIENTDNHVIIRNMPKSRAFMDSMVNYFIHAGLCNSEEDFKILSPDVCIVKKTVYIDDNIPEDTNCACTAQTSQQKQLGRPNVSIIGCRSWCDDSALSAISWCSNYPTLCLINACNSAVIEIQNNCRSCCQNGFSQDLCAAPFGDIVAVMQKYLPPCGGCRAMALESNSVARSFLEKAKN